MTGARSRRTGSAVNVFLLGDAYYFRHYFEGEAVFDRLREYYEPDHYRFVVPVAEFEGVRRFLADHGYDLETVADPDRFAVAVRKYSDHPPGIFGDCVARRSREDYNCFLLVDRAAVREATAHGAIPLPETDLSLTVASQTRLTAV